MKMKNPIKNRLQAETFKSLAETFLGKKNFTWWALLYASLLFIVTGWLPDGFAELFRNYLEVNGLSAPISSQLLWSYCFILVMNSKMRLNMKGGLRL